MASSCPIKDLEGTPLVASTSMNYEGMEVKDSARAYFGNSSNETNTTHTGTLI